jgi:hypothetical protein
MLVLLARWRCFRSGEREGEKGLGDGKKKKRREVESSWRSRGARGWMLGLERLATECRVLAEARSGKRHKGGAAKVRRARKQWHRRARLKLQKLQSSAQLSSDERRVSHDPQHQITPALRRR